MMKTEFAPGRRVRAKRYLTLLASRGAASGRNFQRATRRLIESEQTRGNGNTRTRVSNSRMTRALHLTAIAFFLFVSKPAGYRGSDRLIAVLQKVSRYPRSGIVRRRLRRSHDAGYRLSASAATRVRPPDPHIHTSIHTSHSRRHIRVSAEAAMEDGSLLLRCCVSRSDRACIANARSLAA